MAGRFAKIALASAAVATTLLPVAAEAHGGGWNRGGWGGRGWHRDRGGIDGGDVLAGILIIGGIAAIATAASNAEKRKREAREDDGYRYRPEEDRRDDRRDGWRDQSDRGSGSSARSLNDAVEVCAAEAERSGEIEEVYDATRNGDGYRVSGTFRNGDRFSCGVGRDGGVLLDLRKGRL